MSRCERLARLRGMKVVVLGGGYAGITCALRLARKGAEVTLVNASDQFVERIRLHEAAVGHAPPRRAIARFLEGTSVELVIGRAANVRGKVVELDDGRTLVFDHLVLALGSRSERREGALTVDDDVAARLPAAKSVLVVGGGLTGVETASEIAETWPHVRVTLATRGAVGAGFSDDARRYIEEVFERLGVALLPNTDYQKLSSDFDMTIWAGGFVGAPLPTGLSVKTNGLGQVLVEPSLRALGADSVWVCGDLAAQAFVPPIPVPMGCKTAGPSAARVADNILGETKPFDFVALGYCVSLGRRSAFVELASGRVMKGRLAVWLKELICKATIFAFALERWGLASYSLFEGGNIRELPASTTRVGSES